MQVLDDDSQPLHVLGSGFRFGITSAATCIESRPIVGDAVSIWDVFAGAPGRVTDGSYPQAGPDHFTHWRSDVQLLADLGVDSYRLSLSWSALAAEGPDGPTMTFYQRLLDLLTETGVRPVVTLTHYDMPLAVMEQGGWLVRDTADRFADLATDAVTRLGDRVNAWVTLNSPFIHSALGYGVGIEAPGLTLLGGALTTAEHQLVGHGLATQALRAGGAYRVGVANAHTRVRPAGVSDEDHTAAELYDALHNRVFTDPLLGRGWPSAVSALGGAPDFDPSDADLAAITAPLDFYGVNYYHPQWVAAEPANRTVPFALADSPAGTPTDGFGWPIDAGALTDTLVDLDRRCPDLPTLWVTENGTQDDGGADDVHRGDFFATHVAAVADAARAGVDVQGYFHWSLLDGWEFAEGLTRHFGLVAVDPGTRQRTPKRSYRRYRDLVARHRAGAPAD